MTTGGDLAKTTDTVNSVLKAFRGQGLEAARAAQVLFEVARQGDVSIDEVGSSMEAILPLASQLGVRFEELAAFLIAARQAGGGFTQGVTGVRAVLTALANVTGDSAKALEGLDYSEAAIRARGLVPVLVEISERLGGNSAKLREVFTDARSFGVVLGVLANDGESLTRALADLNSGADTLADALGRKLANPAVQLRVLFNAMRSEFAATFGGAFFAGVSRAVGELGGLEAATETIRTIFRSLGSVSGTIFPVIAEAVADAAKKVQLLLDSLGGADAIEAKMRASAEAIADILGGALKISRVQLESLINAILLVPQVVGAASGEIKSLLDFGADEELEKINRQIATLDKALAALESPEFFKDVDKRPLFKEALQFVPLINDEVLKRRIAELKAERVEIQVRVDAGNGFESLESDIEDVQKSLVGTAEGMAQIESGIRDLGNALTSVGAPAERTFAAVKAELDGVQKSIELSTDELRLLSNFAKIAFSALDGGALDSFLADLASQAATADDALRADQVAAKALKEELAGFVLADIEKTNQQIKSLELSMRDAKVEASLLGLSGAEAAVAIAAVGSSEDERKLAALRAALAELRKQYTELAGEVVIPAPKITPPNFKNLEPFLRFSFQTALDAALRVVDPAAGARSLVVRLTRAIQSALGRGDAIRAEDLFSRREAAELEARAAEAAQGALGEFGGFKEAAELIRESFQVPPEAADRAKVLTDERKESDALVRVLARLIVARGQDLRSLGDLEDALRGVSAARAEAFEDPGRFEVPTLDDLEGFEPIELFDESNIVTGQQAIAKLVNDARKLAGLAPDFVGPFEELQGIVGATSFEGQIEQMRREAEIVQHVVDLARERLSLSPDQIDALQREADALGLAADAAERRAGVEAANAATQEFQRNAPFVLEAASFAANGFANAIADIATGAKSAKDAFADFARSFLADIARMIAQAAALAAIRAFGIPVPAAQGGVVANAQGAVYEAASGVVLAGPGSATVAPPESRAFAAGATFAASPHVAFAAGAVLAPSRAPVQAGTVQDAPVAPTLRGGSRPASTSIEAHAPPLRALGRAVRAFAAGVVLAPVRAYAAGAVMPDYGAQERAGAPTSAPIRAMRLVSSTVRNFAAGAALVASVAAAPARVATVASVAPEARAAVASFAAGDRFTPTPPRNSIVTTPTLSPLARFGEAGPEAILPVRAREGGFSVDVVQPPRGSAASARAARSFAAGQVQLTRGAGGRLSVLGFAKEDAFASGVVLARPPMVRAFASGVTLTAGVRAPTARAFASGAVLSTDARAPAVHAFAQGDVLPAGERVRSRPAQRADALAFPSAFDFRDGGVLPPLTEQRAASGAGGKLELDFAMNISLSDESSSGSDVAGRVRAELASPRVREHIEGVVIEAVRRSVGYRSEVRGDRV